MPERLDRITVALDGGAAVLTRNERDSICWLLRKRRGVGEAAGIRACFDAIGASRPVELSQGQRIELLIVLEEFMHERDVDSIAPGLYELRNALWDEVHEAEKRRAAADLG